MLIFVSCLGVDAGGTPAPNVVTTISTKEQKVLLNLQYEVNPPLHPGTFHRFIDCLIVG